MVVKQDKPKNIRKITCIQMDSKYPDICHKLIMPDYGISIIGSVLAEHGYDVEIFIEHVQPPDWATISSSHLICISTMSAAASRTYHLADKIRSDLNIPVVIGGTHATYFLEDCLKHCDIVVLREGDDTIVELVNSLANNGALSGVAGIAYKENGRTVITACRRGPATFDTIQNYKLINGFRKFSWVDIHRKSRVPLLTVQSSRGCPFHCSFCIVDTMFDNYRVRNIENIMADLTDKRQYGRKLLFVDNYFGADISYTKQLLKRMIEADFDFKIMVLCRIDIARDEELLALMRKAGIVALYIGIESIQPETLVGYAKGQTVEKIRSTVKKFHSFGFRLSGSFVVGADTDSLETIEATVRFAIESEIEVCYFFPIWGHYIEKKLGNRSIIPWYRSIFKGWDYCDGNFVTHFPKHMRPSDLQRAVIDAHRNVYSARVFLQFARRKNWVAIKEKAANLYAWKFIEKGLQEYIPWLKSLEKDFYDKNGRLIKNRLWEFVEKNPWWTFPETKNEYLTNGNQRDTYSPLEMPISDIRNIHCKM
jgi:radical SAM superfamily enzyme YgiQ (UPF0313 family)